MSTDDILGKPKRHPSYGLIGVSRYTVTPPQHLVGSSVRHSSGISIRISSMHAARSLSDDRFYADDTLIEVNLSPAQYAEMICAPNIGDGVPCTITYMNPKLAQIAVGKVGECPHEDERAAIREDFKKTMTKLTGFMDGLLAQAEALQEKPNVTKADRKAFLDIATTIRAQIDNVVPFVRDQFEASTEHIVKDAKATLEAFISSLTQAMGAAQLKQLSQQAQPMLEDVNKS